MEWKRRDVNRKFYMMFIHEQLPCRLDEKYFFVWRSTLILKKKIIPIFYLICQHTQKYFLQSLQVDSLCVRIKGRTKSGDSIE